MWRTLWGTYSPIRQWYFTWKPPVVTVMTRGNFTIIHCCSIYASPPSWFPLAVYICLHRAGNRMSTTEGAARERLFYSACALIYIYDQTEITITGLKMKKSTGQRERKSFWSLLTSNNFKSIQMTCLCCVWNMNSEAFLPTSSPCH